MSDTSIWDLVVGHDEAVAMLTEAVTGGRVSHAWLFTGPPGIGKLHTARVFAAALNCPAGGDGTCNTCRRILRGVHPDVHLLVPEGDNLLVEDVRAVREEASRTHHEARTAVFILDEADRMTEAAASLSMATASSCPTTVSQIELMAAPDPPGHPLGGPRTPPSAGARPPRRSGRGRAGGRRRGRRSARPATG